MSAPIPETEIVIDRTLLVGLVQKRRLFLLIVGALMALVALGFQVFFQPQKYTTSASIIMQQGSSGGLSALGMLVGQSSSPRKYVGLLKSRQLADDVEAKLHLQELYGFKSHKQVVALLQGAVKAEEKADDGLVYVQVTLPGSPLISPGSKPENRKMKQVTAEVANSYVAALKRFYVLNDNERDSILLREAEKEATRARTEYAQARTRISDFIRNLRKQESQTAPTSSDEQPTATAGELLALYSSLSKTETELRAAEAGQETEQRLTAEQLQNLKTLPSEDPLLTQARNDRNDTARRLALLEIQLGPDNARVVTLRKQLQQAERTLREQEAGIRNHRTTPQVLAQSEIERLRVRQQTIKSQIAEAEAKLPLRRELTDQFDRLKSELLIKLEVRKTTEAKWAELRISTVSAQNRLFVVDNALPAEDGSPNMVRIVLLCIVVFALVPILWITGEYVIIAARRNIRAAQKVTAG